MTGEQNNEMFAIGILQICQDLHMHKTGSGMHLDEMSLHVRHEYLLDRLNTWTEPTSVYDLRVKDLARTTIEEWEK